MLIIFSGLPGTGKSTIARELARQLDAVYVRIDSIEQAIRDSGIAVSVEDAGYRVGYAMAEDNLRLGRTVVADSVNPLSLTREAWRGVAARASMPAIDVEVVCSDTAVHRHRVETRAADVPGLRLPTWDEVAGREYDRWEQPRIVVDTAHRPASESVTEIRAALAKVKR